MLGQIRLNKGSELGRYLLAEHLASGGMADVWLARAKGVGGFQKTVVIKTLRPDFAEDPNFVRMFIDEALLACELDHPNIVHIFDLGQLGNTYFIAMEFIAGKNLRQIQRTLETSEQLVPPWLVLHAGISVCNALEYAHNHKNEQGQCLNIVHRDVTPDNIMASFIGVIKVLDFGIAKASTSTVNTGKGILKGKYAYVAPEQILRSHIKRQPDARADIYSLGVSLYEMLCGFRPFMGANNSALLRAILEQPPFPPHEVAPWVPRELSDIILCAIARNPDDRYATAGEFRLDLERYAQVKGLQATDRRVSEYICKLYGVDQPGEPTAHPPDHPIRVSIVLDVPPDPTPNDPISDSDEPSGVILARNLIANQNPLPKPPLVPAVSPAIWPPAINVRLPSPPSPDRDSLDNEVTGVVPEKIDDLDTSKTTPKRQRPPLLEALLALPTEASPFKHKKRLLAALAATIVTLALLAWSGWRLKTHRGDPPVDPEPTQAQLPPDYVPEPQRTVQLSELPVQPPAPSPKKDVAAPPKSPGPASAPPTKAYSHPAVPRTAQPPSPRPAAGSPGNSGRAKDLPHSYDPLGI